MTDRNVLGVIGGSGLYEMVGLSEVEEARVETPFGAPSDAIVRGRLGETELLFLPRHGRHHGIPPHQIPYRANVCAMKKLGATHLISVSAVGSMKEEIAPGDFVVVDQFLDLTKRRVSTFFEDGLVGHVGLGDPVCEHLSRSVATAAERVGARVHRGCTYVCIEGPQFSTRAESRLYRLWGASVIGMTAMPEAKLAREAALPYALLALATDYDCWHESEEDVSAGAVVAVVQANVARARQVISEIARDPSALSQSHAPTLGNALMTALENVPASTRERLAWLIGA